MTIITKHHPAVRPAARAVAEEFGWESYGGTDLTCSVCDHPEELFRRRTGGLMDVLCLDCIIYDYESEIIDHVKRRLVASKDQQSN